MFPLHLEALFVKFGVGRLVVLFVSSMTSVITINYGAYFRYILVTVFGAAPSACIYPPPAHPPRPGHDMVFIATPLKRRPALVTPGKLRPEKKHFDTTARLRPLPISKLSHRE